MTAKTNQNAWIVKVTMLLYQEIAQNGKLRKTLRPSDIQKRFHSQTSTTHFRPIKGFICNCNTDPSSFFQDLFHPGPEKNPTSNWFYDRDWVFEIYFKLLPDTIGYIRWNHSRKSSSSRCTFFRWNTPSTTNFSRTNEIPNTESALQSAASNDIINDENEIEMFTMSNKRPIHEDSSEEDPASPLPANRLPLVAQLVGSLAPMCQKGGEGEI